MPWTWIRPADERLLEGRPLLDVGTGDGQTLRALIEPKGVVVGVDRSLAPMRNLARSEVHVAAAEATSLPFVDRCFAVVLAGDLFHHLDDAELARVLDEFRRVLREEATLVAWWYGEPGRSGVDAPRHPRPYEVIVSAFEGFGSVEPLELAPTVDAGPPTAGVIARR
jgi:SAM-dependent methyltransferase